MTNRRNLSGGAEAPPSPAAAAACCDAHEAVPCMACAAPPIAPADADVAAFAEGVASYLVRSANWVLGEEALGDAWLYLVIQRGRRHPQDSEEDRDSWLGREMVEAGVRAVLDRRGVADEPGPDQPEPAEADDRDEVDDESRRWWDRVSARDDDEPAIREQPVPADRDGRWSDEPLFY